VGMLKIKSIGLLFILLTLCTNTIFAQNSIYGHITDVNGNVLRDINVLLLSKDSSLLLNFSITNEKGYYSIILPQKTNFYIINIKTLHYETVYQQIENKEQKIDFKLKESENSIKEVVVKSNPVFKQGDTISYIVRAFATQEDRVLADVLRKMPGIEVATNGQITYLGKPIEKYYIEGIDLLEGNYNIANNNIPYDAVSTVQVLDNHQSVKVFEEFFSSNNVSLNIKLKKKTTFASTVNLSTGIPFLLRDINITPMLFTKKQQMLFSYQSSNIGNDIYNDLISLSISDLVNAMENNDYLNNYFYNENSTPFFETSERYLFNDAHLGNMNYLIRLKKDIHLRVNASYYKDKTKISRTNSNYYYFDNDTIGIEEDLQSDVFTDNFNAKFTIYSNRNKDYLKNVFDIKYENTLQNDELFVNNENFRQSFKIPFLSFSNKFHLIKPIGGKLISFYSYTNYNESLQSLNINQGVINHLLNDSLEHTGFVQNAKLNTFNSNNYIETSARFNNSIFSFRCGLKYQTKQTFTNIYQQYGLTLGELDTAFQNNMDVNVEKYYLEIKQQYNRKKLKFDFNVPFVYQKIRSRDNINDYSIEANHLFIEPNAYIEYKVLKKIKLTSLFNYTKNVEIDNANTGYILRNYNYIDRGTVDIDLENNTFLGKTNIIYENPVHSFFLSGGYSFSKLSADYIIQSYQQTSGEVINEIVPVPDNSTTNTFYLKTSKFFPKTKTTLFLNMNYSLQEQTNYINGSVHLSKTNQTTLNPKIYIQISKKARLELKSRIIYSEANLTNSNVFSYSQNEYFATIKYYPSKKQYLSFSFDYYNNSGVNSDYIFMNAKYQFSYKYVDFELTWRNILNTDVFSSYTTNQNYVNYQTYKLRPSEVHFSVKFSINTFSSESK
jgi:hypothetical protein